MGFFGGVEAGGTKFVCVVADEARVIRAETRFATTTPDETLGGTIAFFSEQGAAYPMRAIGVASFGPLDLDPASPTYGYITNTPKPGWAGVDFAGRLRAAFGLPLGFDTDVNAAALGEYLWGAGRGADPVAYFTIGTGIGGGFIVHGKPLHGLVHPESGHICVPRSVKDAFPGVCPYHGDCFEGLASGTALRQRWGQPAETLPDDHPAWQLEAEYIARALVNVILLLSPQRIVLGGGVMQRTLLFPLVRRKTTQLLNRYVGSPVLGEEIENYIVPPQLGGYAGALGAVALGMQAASQENQ